MNRILKSCSSGQDCVSSSWVCCLKVVQVTHFRVVLCQTVVSWSGLMVSWWGPLSSGWSMVRVVLCQGGLSGWSLVNMVLH